MTRAIDIGPVDAAAIRTRGGKIRLRLHFTVAQLESMLRAAMATDDDDDETVDANVEHMKRSVTQCDAETGQRREEKIRKKDDDGGDAGARGPPVFVIEGTRAWKAWIAEKKRQTGRTFDLTTTATVEGKSRRGWYFPTLFPPAGADQPEPLSESDSRETANL